MPNTEKGIAPVNAGNNRRRSSCGPLTKYAVLGGADHLGSEPPIFIEGKGVKKKEKSQESVTLDEALEIAGFGKHSYLVVVTAGINILGSISTTLLLSYILPATDCDLNLSTSQKGFLSSLMLTGMLGTTHLFGVLADEYGRKYISMRCNIMSSTLTLVTAFCPNFTAISAVTFLNGAVSAGVIVPAYIYVGEIIPLKYRQSSILAAAAFGNVSNVMLPALAIVIIPLSLGWDFFGFLTFNSWRLLIALTCTIPMTGAILFTLLDESPKFLLTKGFNEETRGVLQRMYSLNCGRSKEDFPVRTIRLDTVDEDNQSDEKPSMKRVLMQTVLLFRKPLKKWTIIACIVQAGVFAATNIIYLWLPQIVNQMMTHSAEHPEYGVTFCQVLQTKDEIFDIDSLNDTNQLIYETQDLSNCIVNVPIDTYYVATLMGVTQLATFLLTGWLSHQVGSKRLLVTNMFLCGAMIFGSTLTKDIWSTIVLMIGSGVVAQASIPIALGIIMGLFPTNVRSTASCLTFFTGRLVSTIGMQIMAALQGNYCDFSYWGLGLNSIGVGLLVLFGLPGSVPAPLENFDGAPHRYSIS